MKIAESSKFQRLYLFSSQNYNHTRPTDLLRLIRKINYILLLAVDEQGMHLHAP